MSYSRIFLIIVALLTTTLAIYFASPQALANHGLCEGNQCMPTAECGAASGRNCSTKICHTDLDCNPSEAVRSIGFITPPVPILNKGPAKLFGNILRIAFSIAGLWAFLNIIIAGFQFISAGGDPKAIQSAMGRIWQSLIGLIIIVGSFVLAAIIGFLVFGDVGYILRPAIFSIGSP